jgi:cysteine desulfurase
MLYLDSNATTKPCDAAIEAAETAMREAWQNPSSVHRAGQGVRAKVELARAAVANLIGSKPRDVVFTSSGTESVHLAIRGAVAALAKGERPPLVASTLVEHSAGREVLKDMESRGEARVLWLPIDINGVVDVAALARALASDDKPMVVSVQWANNETGVIQPVDEIARLCKAAGSVFHCDCVQWAGKEPMRVEPSGPDAPFLDANLVSISAHKFHGLKGTGALYIRRGTRVRTPVPGNQELGRRGGTENVPGILAAGAAAEEASEWLSDAGTREKLRTLRDRFEQTILAAAPGSVVNSGGAPRLWNTSNIAFPKFEAEAILLALSERGLCASAGAACASGSLEPSPVLLAMGIDPKLAHGSVRFSLSKWTTDQEIDEAVALVIRCVESLRASTAAAV